MKKRCEIVKSNNRIIQKSKSSNMQKIWNIKKIYVAFENNICKKNIIIIYISYKHEARFMDLAINIKIINETYNGKQSRPEL